MNNVFGINDMVKRVVEATGCDAKVANVAIKGFVEQIGTVLHEGDAVRLVGFGNFETVDRDERQARNVFTGETITVPAKTVPKFKFSKTFKDKFIK